MRARAVNLTLLAVCLVVLSGCISIPPLIKVDSHKESNAEVLRRLDCIDRRIDQLEKKVDQKTEVKPN